MVTEVHHLKVRTDYSTVEMKELAHMAVYYDCIYTEPKSQTMLT